MGEMGEGGTRETGYKIMGKQTVHCRRREKKREKGARRREKGDADLRRREKGKGKREKKN
jgi:hypothetical protein